MNAGPYLEWTDENHQRLKKRIIDRICIGRTCEGIAPQQRVLLEDRRISRIHADISYTAGRLRIVDSGRNGTWVNNIRMAAGSHRILADGDTIRIGEYLFQVVFPQKESVTAMNRARTELTVVSPVSEVVTALVADVRGFTAYSQRHSSSEVVGMIKQIFNRFSEIIEAHNGTIKDFAGDAVFAFWEHKFEKAATQSTLACRAALQQWQGFVDLRTEMAVRFADIAGLQMGWGITTGPIVLSHFGSRAADLAMVGDCVNLAFRLSGMAKKEIPENILLCSRTAESIDNTFTLTDMGKHTIRGREGREHIYALPTA